MKKILIAALAASLLTAGAASAFNPTAVAWMGWLARKGEQPAMGNFQKVEIFQDRNGCQYLVATGGQAYYGTYSISITPRINSATRQPHCP